MQIPDRNVNAIKNLRRACGGTQTTIITLPAVWANKLLGASKVKIRWVVYRIREKISPAMGFLCLQQGDIARFSTKKNDKFAPCRRYSEKGHLARNCKKDFERVLCKDADFYVKGHAAGSGKCPQFKRESKGKSELGLFR